MSVMSQKMEEWEIKRRLEVTRGESINSVPAISHNHTSRRVDYTHNSCSKGGGTNSIHRQMDRAVDRCSGMLTQWGIPLSKDC